VIGFLATIVVLLCATVAIYTYCIRRRT